MALLLALLSFKTIENRSNSALVILISENALSILSIKYIFHLQRFGVDEDLLSLIFFLVFCISYLTLFFLEPYFFNKLVSDKDKRMLIYYKSFFSSSIESDKKLNSEIIEKIISYLNFSSHEQTIAYKDFLQYSKSFSSNIKDLFDAKDKENRAINLASTFPIIATSFFESILIKNSKYKNIDFKCAIYRKDTSDQLAYVSTLNFTPKQMKEFSGSPLSIENSFAGYCYQTSKPLIYPIDKELTDNRWEVRNESEKYQGFFCIPIDEKQILIIEGSNKESIETLNHLRPLALLFAQNCKILLDISLLPTTHDKVEP